MSLPKEASGISVQQHNHAIIFNVQGLWYSDFHGLGPGTLSLGGKGNQKGQKHRQMHHKAEIMWACAL